MFFSVLDLAVFLDSFYILRQTPFVKNETVTGNL